MQYRIISGNEGGFFRIEENTGNIVSASLFKGKKGQRYTIKVTASDNYGRTPSLEAAEPATVRVSNFFLLKTFAFCAFRSFFHFYFSTFSIFEFCYTLGT